MSNTKNNKILLSSEQVAPCTSILTSVIESIRDPEALGIYAYLLSKHTAPISLDDIENRFKISTKRAKAKLKVLEEMGLIDMEGDLL